MSVTSPRHSEEPSQGVSRRVSCSPSFCVLRSSARPPSGCWPCVNLSDWLEPPCHPMGCGHQSQGDPWSGGRGWEGGSGPAQPRHNRDPTITAVPWGHLGRGRDSPQMIAGPRRSQLVGCFERVCWRQRKLGKALWSAGNSMPRAPRWDQQAMWPGLREDLGLSL